MIDDGYYAIRHRVLIGRDAGFAGCLGPAKPKGSVTVYLIHEHAKSFCHHGLCNYYTALEFDNLAKVQSFIRVDAIFFSSMLLFIVAIPKFDDSKNAINCFPRKK